MHTGVRILFSVILLALLITFPGFAQRIRIPDALGGSGNDSINAATVDSAGNIYVVGTTQSFDFPLRNAFQTVNSGTQLIVSADAGASWKPLGNPFPSASSLQPLVIASDPTNAQIVYAASANKICKSTDGGYQFQCSSIAFASIQTYVSSLAIDPRQPLTVYASANVEGGVFKSIDGGQTWANASQGLPDPLFIDSVTIDPFHSNVLYAWAGSGGYVSTDGANSWSQVNLQPLGSDISGSLNFSFDPVTPGIIYGPALTGNRLGIQKSTDGGATWTQLNTPFSNCCVVPDPKISGLLYATAQSEVPGAPLNFWKSSDGGASWKSHPLVFQQGGSIAVDPQNSQIILFGGSRSTDGGQTWKATNASSLADPVFAHSSSNLAYATAPITSDAFLAKFLPDGKTLAFSTYFGGMDIDTGQGIALDASGNIWISGSTSSHDLPVTAGAFQGTQKGASNAFAAKFSNDGKLLAATYLGGSSDDNGLGIAISPEGNPWLIGSWNSTDFPFTAAASANLPSGASGFLTEFDPSATRLLYSTYIGGTFDINGKGIAIDSSGNITLTGSNYGGISVSAGAFHSGVADGQSPNAFVVKLAPSGQVIYSSTFGGSQTAQTPDGLEKLYDYGIAVAVDDGGNAYVTGYTSATDFPTTPGAYQRSLADGCAYPAFSIDTGLFGEIYEWFFDDVFVVKLSPDGTAALFSTYLGGSCYDRSTSIAVDASGQIYVAGETDSGDFPLVLNAAAAPPTPQFASFVSVFNPSGSALSFSTYLYAGAAPTVVADPNGSILIAGSSGPGAQSQAFAFAGLPVTGTHGYLAVIDPAALHRPAHHPRPGR